MNDCIADTLNGSTLTRCMSCGCDECADRLDDMHDRDVAEATEEE
jgi:hypothetical protein